MGELFALLSACCFAAASVVIARGAGARGQDNGAFQSILITTAIAGAIWSYYLSRNGWPHFNSTAMWWFAGAGVLTIFIGRVFLYASVQYLGAMQASSLKRLNPFFSVLLGVLVLGETLDLSLIVGMLLIFSSFALLIRQSIVKRPSHSESEAAGPITARSWLGLINLGFFYGAASAMAYAVGYVGRKQGLILMPDAAFGTMFGSVVGALLFIIVAQFIDSYRQALRATFTTFNPWLTVAGILSSMGQLFQFSALNHAPISRVALITSMEAFITIFLTVVVFRSREKVTPSLLLAASLGAAGTAFVVLH
jgi:drug/metabolite transporter (DMT)-like permease